MLRHLLIIDVESLLYIFRIFPVFFFLHQLLQSLSVLCTPDLLPVNYILIKIVKFGFYCLPLRILTDMVSFIILFKVLLVCPEATAVIITFFVCFC